MNDADGLAVVDDTGKSSRESAKLLLTEMGSHDADFVGPYATAAILAAAGRVVHEARKLLRTESAPAAATAAVKVHENSETTSMKASQFGTDVYRRLEDMFGMRVPAGSRMAYKLLKELSDNVLQTGQFGPKFLNLAAGVSQLNASTGEDKTQLADNIIVVTGGDAKVELSRLGPFLKAIDIVCLGLLAIGSIPVPAVGFGSKGEEGWMVGAGDVRQRWHCTLHTLLEVRTWALDMVSTQPLTALPHLWGIMAGRAQDLLLGEENCASALSTSCREHGRFHFPHQLKEKVEESKEAKEAKELAKVRADLKSTRGELDLARGSLKRNRDSGSWRQSAGSNGRSSGGGGGGGRGVPSPSGDKLCGDFQKNNCTRANCIFAHECRRCGSTSHGGDSPACPRR